MTRSSSSRLQFIHSAALDLSRLLAGLLDLKPNGVAALQAEQVGEASELVRPAMNLDGLPSQRFGYPNNRRDDVGLAWHPVYFLLGLPGFFGLRKYAATDGKSLSFQP